MSNKNEVWGYLWTDILSDLLPSSLTDLVRLGRQIDELIAVHHVETVLSAYHRVF